jgi:nitroimidazol reductase NimA-like FMN-containing flavoprotein (pyridoxamine 5'-phosphate oxidase superfamily)
MDKKIIAKIKTLLEYVEFLDIATADSQAQPNAAPKFLLKIEGASLYMVDCVMGKTWLNIQANPRVSIPVMDIDTLIGYRINGRAKVIDGGAQNQELLDELTNKQIKLSTERIVRNIRQEKGKRNLEVQFPDTVGMFVVEVENVVEIGPTGKLAREDLSKEKI